MSGNCAFRPKTRADASRAFEFTTGDVAVAGERMSVLTQASYKRRKQSGHRLPLFVSVRNDHNSGAFSDHNRFTT